MSIGAVACAMSWVEGSFNCNTMSSTSYKRSWNLPSLDSNSFIWAVVCAAVSEDLVLVYFWLLGSYVFALSSIFVILSTRSSTTFSRWSMRFCYVWLRSFCSTISSYSFVMSSFSYFHRSFMATFLSSCCSLTSTAVSPIYRTLSSRAFPAVYTILIYSSAYSCQVLVARDFTTRSVTWAAWFLRFSTTWD
jgi:hypothetical protein